MGNTATRAFTPSVTKTALTLPQYTAAIEVLAARTDGAESGEIRPEPGRHQRPALVRNEPLVRDAALGITASYLDSRDASVGLRAHAEHADAQACGKRRYSRAASCVLAIAAGGGQLNISCMIANAKRRSATRNAQGRTSHTTQRVATQNAVRSQRALREMHPQLGHVT